MIADLAESISEREGVILMLGERVKLSPVLAEAPSVTGVSAALALPSGIMEALSSAPSKVLVVAAVAREVSKGFSCASAVFVLMCSGWEGSRFASNSVAASLT